MKAEITAGWKVCKDVPMFDEIVAELKEHTDTVFLAFSNGKDSLCTWWELKRKGLRVIPYFQQMIPNLDFVERDLQYYEEKFDTPILRVHDPVTYKCLEDHVYAHPADIVVLNNTDLSFPDEQTYLDMIAATAGYDGMIFQAYGHRATDSFGRAREIKRANGLELHTGRVYPIWHYTEQDVLSVIARAGLKLSPAYKYFGRSHESALQPEHLNTLAEHYPKAFAQVLELYPLAQVAIERRKMEERHFGKFYQYRAEEQERKSRGLAGERTGTVIKPLI